MLSVMLEEEMMCKLSMGQATWLPAHMPKCALWSVQHWWAWTRSLQACYVSAQAAFSHVVRKAWTIVLCFINWADVQHFTNLRLFQT